MTIETEQVDVGDTVLVRYRESRKNGQMQAKFLADVVGVDETPGPGSDKLLLSPPWDPVTPIRLAPYEAEIEVVEDESEVQF